MDKRITDFSQSDCRTRSFFDDDDDLLHSFDFPPSLTQDPTSDRGRRSSTGIGTDHRIEALFGAAVVFEVNRKMKEQMDTLLHAVGQLNARLSQVETRTRRLDNAVDGLKDSIEFNHGRTEGKLRDLHNILEEVQGGIRDLRDKQDITEAQLHLAMLKESQVEKQSRKQNSSSQISSVLQISSTQPFGTPPNLLSTCAAAATAPLLPAQNASPFYWQTEPNHLPSWFTPEMTLQKNQVSSDQRMKQPVLYEPSSQLSPHLYYVGPNRHIQDQYSNRLYPDFAPGHSQAPEQSTINNHGPPYGAWHSSNTGLAKEHLQLPQSSSISSSAHGFSKFPNGKMLPRALPTAAPVDSGLSSGELGNKVPIDDVIERVVAMGFRRDLVRTTVKKFTANGQSVDLNIVLDKLMNGGND